MAEEQTNLDDAVWALIFFGIGSITFMNRSETTGPWIIICGSISFIVACYFVFRLLVKPRR